MIGKTKGLAVQRSAANYFVGGNTEEKLKAEREKRERDENNDCYILTNICHIHQKHTQTSSGVRSKKCIAKVILQQNLT